MFCLIALFDSSPAGAGLFSVFSLSWLAYVPVNATQTRLLGGLDSIVRRPDVTADEAGLVFGCINKPPGDVKVQDIYYSGDTLSLTTPDWKFRRSRGGSCLQRKRFLAFFNY